MFVVAGFAVIAHDHRAVWTGSRPRALGVAVMGVIALLIFLIMDLPDAGQVGTLDDARQSFIDAEAVPQGGFWLEMLGALGPRAIGRARWRRCPRSSSIPAEANSSAAARRSRRPEAKS